MQIHLYLLTGEYVCVLFISVLTEGLFNRTDRVDHYVKWDGLRRKVCQEIALICIWLNLNGKHKATHTLRRAQLRFIDMQRLKATSD